MKTFIVFTLLTLGGLFWRVKSQEEKVTFCQYEDAFWPVEELAPDGFCTHLSSLVGLDDIVSGNMLNSSYRNKFLNRLNRLKRRNPSLVTLLGIPIFEVKEELNYDIIFDTLDMYGFDGMDIYWYLPYWKLKDLGAVKELKRRLAETNRILSASLRYIPEKIHEVKLVKEVGVEADLFTLAPFNFLKDKASAVSPIGDADANNIVNAIDHILSSKKVPREKLLLGLPFFGVQTTSKINGDGSHSSVRAHMPYKWICEKLTPKPTPWVELWDARTLTPFLLNNETGQVINFDNVESLKKKIELVEMKKLRGIAVFDVHSDDDEGKCGEGKYPLATPLRKYFDLLAVPFTFATGVKNEEIEFF